MADDFDAAVDALKGSSGWFAHITIPDDWTGLIDQMRWDPPCAIVVCAMVAAKKLELELAQAIERIGTLARRIDREGTPEESHADSILYGAELMLAWLDRLQ